MHRAVEAPPETRCVRKQEAHDQCTRSSGNADGFFLLDLGFLGSQPSYLINANNSAQSLAACGVRLAKADHAAMHAKHIVISYVKDLANRYQGPCEPKVESTLEDMLIHISLMHA